MAEQLHEEPIALVVLGMLGQCDRDRHGDQFTNSCQHPNSHTPASPTHPNACRLNDFQNHLSGLARRLATAE